MRTWRLGVLALAASLGASMASNARADPPPRIHLRGSAHIDAHWAHGAGGTHAGEVSLAGTVVDDTARAVSGARVGLRIAGADGSAAGQLSLVDAAPAACSEGASPPSVESADALVLPADDSGRFCVRLVLPATRGAWVAHLDSRTAGPIDAARLDVPIDLSLAPVTLRFDPEPRNVHLDEGDDAARSFVAVASTESDGVTTGAAQVVLSLSNETGAMLATATTDANGQARFDVPIGKLGAPGRGELRVSFAGSATAGAALHSAPIERRTHVDIAASDAREGRLPPGLPEDGVDVRVAATLRCAKFGCAGAPTGTIEVRVGDDETISGAGSLEGGQAQAVARYASQPEPSQLHVRYVPDAPWLQPGNELSLLQPVRPPSPLRKVPLLLAGLVAIAWLVLARLPPRKPAAARASRAPASHGGRPEAGVELVRAGPAAQGWTGRLHDAHDAYAIAGGRVAVERRGFERIEVLAETRTDAAGVFALPLSRLPHGVAPLPGDELVCEGPLHGQLRRPLPEAGELDVALVLRKRALLDRLVAWARRRGMPYDARPEPTPGHVRRAAGGEFTVARWADAVERAAFGGQVVDARAEGEIERLAPNNEKAPPEQPGPR
ncbi:MAG TPA: hypothetical protein VMI75_39095 [Polyangiaceae bacterium]|nr:hypothetical protein [Polyangiaceae bacterium]